MRRTETCRCNCWTSYSKTEFHKISNSRTELRCGRFYSDILGSGDSFSYTFDEPGTYSYFCSPHPWMTGFVIVDDQDANIQGDDDEDSTDDQEEQNEDDEDGDDE